MSLYKLRPEFVERPWGRVSLDPLYPTPSGAGGEPVGEVWLTSQSCTVESLDGDGKVVSSLGDFWAGLSARMRGAAFSEVERFPLLVKVLFTSSPLSIQVHPDDDYARSEEGEPWGKSEAWHTLSAGPDAWVETGFKQGVTAADVAAAWGTPELAGMLHRFPLKGGDTVYVPAGTVHSIGPDLCLVEVQQYSDVTYRIYDYGRDRELHTEKAKAVARLETPQAGIVSPGNVPAGDGVVSLVSSPYFIVERYAGAKSFETRAVRESLTIFLVTKGLGTVNCGEGKIDSCPGDCYLATAGYESVNWRFDDSCEVLQIRPLMPEFHS